MALDRKLPQPGDRLVHSFRKIPGEVIAEVISVDPGTGKVVVKVCDTNYSSLRGWSVRLRSSHEWLDILGAQENVAAATVRLSTCLCIDISGRIQCEVVGMKAATILD